MSVEFRMLRLAEIGRRAGDVSGRFSPVAAIAACERRVHTPTPFIRFSLCASFRNAGCGKGSE